MAEPTVIHLVPGDVVLVGNMGDITSEQAHRVIRDIQERLPEARVAVFANDIDVKLLRDLD